MSNFGVANFGVANGVLWEQVDLKVMLIDQTSSELVTLNPVGSLIWRTLAAGPAPVDRLAAVVSEAFPEVDLTQAAADVEVFLDELVRLGFVATAA
jgi:coenzyme PQQ synthesis protein D (PqqD)